MYSLETLFSTEGLLQALRLLLVGGVLLGIRWMGSPRTALRGNRLSAGCMVGFIFLTLAGRGLLTSGWIWGALAAGGLVGLIMGLRVHMIQMPELVALLNGFGGGASALVAWLELNGRGGLPTEAPVRLAAGLGIVIGTATLGGSLVAASKLARWMPQRPLRLKGLALINGFVMLLLLTAVATLSASAAVPPSMTTLMGLLALALGTVIVMRVGGADMPVTISLLNSLSGVAAAFAGFALQNFVLVAVGGIVGASGLMLTQIMCHAMNRSLGDILAGRTTASGTSEAAGKVAASSATDPAPAAPLPDKTTLKPGLAEAVAALQDAKRVILVPGYGMAVAQAQLQVKTLYDHLEQAGKEICFAIHPVAGRMPGHMHVLLAEVQIPYDKFIEMEAANPQFASTDVVVVVGANDVINPAANTAVGTPIHGMPILDVAAAERIVICNLDAKPGYAGVDNSLYDSEDAILLFGDAKQTVSDLVTGLATAP